MRSRNYCLTIAFVVLFSGLIFMSMGPVWARTETSKLAVLWTSGDPDVAHRVCFMYTHNAKKQKWFDQVNLIVWGPSSRLLAGDKDIAAELQQMQKDGVIVQACQACADSYGVSDKIRELGFEVKYMGRPLTEMLKSDYKVLTF
jgi:hypothetical protein